MMTSDAGPIEPVMYPFSQLCVGLPYLYLTLSCSPRIPGCRDTEMFFNSNEVHRAPVVGRIHARGIDRMIPTDGRTKRSTRKWWPNGEFHVRVAGLGLDTHDVQVTDFDNSRLPGPEADEFIAVAVRSGMPVCETN